MEYWNIFIIIIPFYFVGFQDKHPEKTNPLENKFTKSLEPQKSPNKQIDLTSLTRSRYQGTNNFNITNNNTSQIGSNLSNLSLTNKDFCKSLTENKIKTWSNLTTGNLHNLEQQNSEGLITKWIGGMERREMSGGGVENGLNVGLNVRTNINNGAGQTRWIQEYNGLCSNDIFFLFSYVFQNISCVYVWLSKKPEITYLSEFG